ncbi:hypothetical protein [Alteromonas halophila]|nr:hypothetical protein [Alteromonas halophila]
MSPAPGLNRLLFFLLAITGYVQADEIVYTRAFDGSEYGYYHRDLLRHALAVTPEFGDTDVVAHSHPMPQGRQIVTLKRNQADVMWSMTSDEREAQLIPVRLPLLKGLAGYRLLIIRKDRQTDFPASLALPGLKQKTAIQGNDWPDLIILKRQGFSVEGIDWSEWYGAMFNMVERGVVDSFPRNIIEVSRDLARYESQVLTLERYHIIRYPTYEYLFVRPSAPQLARRIAVGLSRMIKSGEMEALFMRHENHRQAMTILNDDARTIHDIANPTLSYSLDYARWDLQPHKAATALLTKSK